LVVRLALLGSSSSSIIVRTLSRITTMGIIEQRDYIYSAEKGHRDAMFTAAIQSLDGAKPNTNPNTNPIP